jgi:hypothetical protein
MPRVFRMLCLLLSVSLLLAPLSHAHAHVTAEEHIAVHGGHDHSFSLVEPGEHHGDDHSHDHADDPASDHDATGSHVLELAPDLAKPNAGAKFLQWIAILVISVFALLTLVPMRTAQPPPRIRARPPSPYPHALPLLRGPPHSI